MRQLEQVVVRGDGQALGKQAAGLLLKQVEAGALLRDVGLIQVVAAHLVLVLQEQLAIRHAPVVVTDVTKVGHTLQGHEDALHAIGDLHSWCIQRLAARLLEVGELGDLHAVQPHLPAQAPGAQHGTLPVVLHKAHVMCLGVNAQGLQRPQVQLLAVAGVRLEDDLELGVTLKAVGVVAVPRVVRANGWLCIADVPGLRPKDAQECGRIHSSSSNFGVVWEPYNASHAGPVLLKLCNGLLKGWGLALRAHCGL
mmetsp:Transcript_20995/g.46002  ORF Transcript_20995/g.46002 Transcript_20995/m.46002 type:complete len:253 (+) Transcript_20995:2762-3520(+)